MTDNSEIMVNKDAPTAGSTALTRLENILVVDGANVIDNDFNAPKRIGLIIAFVVFGVFGLWSALVPISGAAHAPGQVTVKSFKKPIQHLEGGIVKEVRVRDGDFVQAGDVLMVMDSTQQVSQLGILTTQLKAKLAQEARLVAQRDKLAAVAYPPELQDSDPLAQQEINAQNQIFLARKTATAGEILILQQKIEQLESRVVGLEALQRSKSQLAASYQDELKDIQSLLAEGFADKNVLRQVERSYEAASGEAADLMANIASARIQISETQQEILQLQNRLHAEVVSQLAETQTELKDIRERVTALSDIVSRTELRSPDSGVVNNLKVHTPDTVVPAGSILAEIVPQSDELIIEAKVSPMDIDRVATGQEAQVRMVAMNSRTVPTLYGTVTALSADAIVDPTNGSTFYLARLELHPESLEDLRGQPLVPGMPAEVFISTGSRTFLQYLMKPITDSMARALRED